MKLVQSICHKNDNDVSPSCHKLSWRVFWDVVFFPKFSLQTEQWCSLLFSCLVLIWILRWNFWPKYLLQNEQWCYFTLSWIVYFKICFSSKIFLQNEHWCSFTFSWTDLKCVSRQSFILSLCYKMNTDEASAYLLLELVLGIFSYLGLEQSCTYWDKQFNIYLNNGLPWLVFFRDTQICFQINISSSFQLVVNLPVLLCKQALYNLSGRL